MNERIQELADRLWRIHPKDIDAMGLKTRKEFYEQELKKFAELIVRECVSLIRKQSIGEEVLGGQRYKTVQLGETIATITEHFGVEE